MKPNGLPYRCAVLLLSLVLSTSTGCSGKTGEPLGPQPTTDRDAGSDSLDPMRPFEPLSEAAALSKVKTFLLGEAPSSEEYARYVADSDTLPSLIDTWLERKELAPRLLELLAFMFQQGAGSDDIGLLLREQNTDIFQQREGRGGVDLETAMRESWALTALNIIAEDRPFTEVATTRTFMLNVPLMMAMAYMDATPRDDTNAYVKGYSHVEERFADLSVRYTREATIPFSDSVNPLSEHYGVFSIREPDGSAAGTNACEGLSSTFTGRAAVEEIYKTMMGAPFRTTCWSWNGAQANVFAPDDYTYRSITVRSPAKGEAPTLFFDLKTLRETRELVLDTPYVGFFGTLGFLTQWTTNDANEYRVTANQTLIVGLGRSFDPSSAMVAIDDLQSDELHAAPGSVCYGCHQTLDPLRDFFRQSYSYWGSPRIDGMGANEGIPELAEFSIDGSPKVSGVGVTDLGKAIAGSERFAPAWVEKMCGLINAGLCAENDPELVRIAGVFRDSGYRFTTLLRELLSSPVVTYRERTLSWEVSGAAVGAALQDDYCRRLAARGGINDACAIRDELDALPGVRDQIASLARALSKLGYPRGAVAPDMPTVPTLFATAAAERVCEALALRFFDSSAGATSTVLFQPDQRAQAISFFTTTLMGEWEGGSRHAELVQVLSEHWDEITASGASEIDALRSTFVLACSAPQTTSFGL